MAKFKQSPIVLLMILLVLARSHFALAQDDEEDEPKTTPKPKDTGIANKVCTIANQSDRKSRVYMQKWVYSVGYKRIGADDKKAKWSVTPVKLGGKTYYELKNVKDKQFMTAHKRNYVYGTSKSFDDTGDVATLWAISPAKQGVAVTIASFKNGFLRVPKRNKKATALSKRSKNKWVITCN